MGNTVRNCAYSPFWLHAAITVYTGVTGPDVSAHVQENVLIANNAVFSAGAGAIAVTNCRDVTIMDNIVTDSDVNSFGDSAIYLNAVSEGPAPLHQPCMCNGHNRMERASRRLLNTALPARLDLLKPRQ